MSLRRCAFHKTQPQALVLNASYEPIKVVSWKKAVVLFYQAKVEVLEHHEVYVRSMHSNHRLPSIIRLKKFVRRKPQLVAQFTRHNVFRRDKFICQYCTKSYGAKDLTLDHVLPVSKGGQKTWTNIVTACRKCNQKKGNKTLESSGMQLLNKPYAPRWRPDLRVDDANDDIPYSWQVYLKYLLDQ